MRHLGKEASDRIDRVLAAKTDNFVELVAAAGLSPATDFRRTYLRGVDFANCALKDFDFCEATFEKCSFIGADLRGANLTDARLIDCIEPNERDPAEESRFPEPDAAAVPVSLADWLVAEERHPLLVFGAPASGKTFFLQSLLAGLSQEHDVVLVPTRGEGTSPYERWISETGRVADDAILPRTASELAFIPVNLASRGQMGGTLKLALMDCGSESLLPRPGQPLPETLLNLLETYVQPISIAYLVPAHPDGEVAARADDVVAGALDTYRRRRSAVLARRDRHLLVFSKWDALAGAGGPGRPSSPEALEQLAARNPEVWNQLRVLRRKSSVALTAFAITDPRNMTFRREAIVRDFASDVVRWLCRGAIEQHRRKGQGVAAPGMATLRSSRVPLRELSRFLKRKSAPS